MSEEVSGLTNLRRAEEDKFRAELSSHYCTYVGVSAFRILLHHLVPQKVEQLRVASLVVKDWEALVRDSFEKKSKAQEAQLACDANLRELDLKYDFKNIRKEAFEAAVVSLRTEILESLLEPGITTESFLKRRRSRD